MKSKLQSLINNFEDITSGLALAGVVILLFIQVIMRYVFHNSMAWTEELSRYFFLYMVYLSTSLAAKQRTHIRVTAQFKLFPERFKKYFLLFADFIWVCLCLVFSYQGFKLVINMADKPLISPVLAFDLKWVFLIIPISFLLQVIRVIQADYLALKNNLPLVVEEGEDVKNVT